MGLDVKILESIKTILEILFKSNGYITMEELKQECGKYSLNDNEIGYMYEYLSELGFIITEEKISTMNEENNGDELDIDSSFTDAEKRYFAEIRQYKVLPQEEQIELIRRYKVGDLNAKQKLINCSLRLVAKEAYKYVGRGLDLLDLIQEGNCGLLKAVEHFNPEIEVKFSTYATCAIRANIIRALYKSRSSIKVSVHTQEDILLIKRAQDHLFMELNREATIEEIATYSGLSISRIQFAFNVMRTQVISYNSPINEGNDDEILELIPGENQCNLVDESLEEEAILKLLNKIFPNPSQYAIIESLFKDGNRTDDTCTVRQTVAKKLGVSKQAVEQAEVKATYKFFCDDTFPILANFFGSDMVTKNLFNIHKQIKVWPFSPSYPDFYSYFSPFYTREEVETIINDNCKIKQFIKGLEEGCVDLNNYKKNKERYSEIKYLRLWRNILDVYVLLRQEYGIRAKIQITTCPQYTSPDLLSSLMISRKLYNGNHSALELNLEDYKWLLEYICKILAVSKNPDYETSKSTRNLTILYCFLGTFQSNPLSISQIANVFKLTTTDIKNIIIEYLKLCIIYLKEEKNELESDDVKSNYLSLDNKVALIEYIINSLVSKDKTVKLYNNKTLVVGPNIKRRLKC